MCIINMKYATVIKYKNYDRLLLHDLSIQIIIYTRILKVDSI